MKSVQGLLFVGVALFLIWLGVTGRFEKIAVAIGVLRDKPITPTPKLVPSHAVAEDFTLYPFPIGPGLP